MQGPRDHPARMLQSGGKKTKRVRSACTRPPKETTGIVRHIKYCTAIQDPHADRSMHQEQDNRKQKIVDKRTVEKMVIVFCESPAVVLWFAVFIV